MQCEFVQNMYMREALQETGGFDVLDILYNAQNFRKLGLQDTSNWLLETVLECYVPPNTNNRPKAGTMSCSNTSMG